MLFVLAITELRSQLTTSICARESNLELRWAKFESQITFRTTLKSILCQCQLTIAIFAREWIKMNGFCNPDHFRDDSKIHWISMSIWHCNFRARFKFLTSGEWNLKIRWELLARFFCIFFVAIMMAWNKWHLAKSRSITIMNGRRSSSFDDVWASAWCVAYHTTGLRVVGAIRVWLATIRDAIQGSGKHLLDTSIAPTKMTPMWWFVALVTASTRSFK